MLRAHRQAWAWQDEWFNMTMEDIREMERQTQQVLALKMGSLAGGNASDSTGDGADNTSGAGGNAPTVQTGHAAKDTLTAAGAASPNTTWPISYISESSSEDEEFFDCQGNGNGGGVMEF